MLRRSAIAALLALLLSSSVSGYSGQSRAFRPELDLDPVYKHSSWAIGSFPEAIGIRDMINALNIVIYEEVMDVNGLNAIEALPLVKTCCLPGVTGTEEHILKLYLLERKQDEASAFGGLLMEVTGYCTLSDVASDLAGLVFMADARLGIVTDFEVTRESILKSLAVTHYRWYMAGAKGAQPATISRSAGPDFSLLVDPQSQAIGLIWPATIPSALTVKEAKESYARYLEDDKLGIEAIVSTNYNSLALSCETSEAVPHSDSSGST